MHVKDEHLVNTPKSPFVSRKIPEVLRLSMLWTPIAPLDFVPSFQPVQSMLMQLAGTAVIP